MLTAAVSFGQGNVVVNNAPTKAKLSHQDNQEPVKATASSNEKAPGDVIWSEDFTGGFPTDWYVMDNTGNGYNWVLDPGVSNVTGDYTNATPIASTSGGNYMLLNGDGYNSPLPPSPIDMDAYFQTNGIMLNGEANVTVRFQQKFRLCCQASAALNLVVSTDSTFATNVGTFDVRQGVAINTQSADPITQSVNITSIVGGYTGRIYLRFHWALGASHYYWSVDDIEVIETVNNDLVISRGYYGSLFVPYTRIPVSQIQPIDFSAFATNVGAADQLNSILTADINGGTFTGTSAPMTIVSGATDSLFTTTSFTPPTSVGIPYNVTLTVSSDSVETTPSNNAETFPPFEVSQYTYAIDDHSATPGNGGGFNTNVTPPTEEFEAGNYYDVIANDNGYAIQVVVGSNTQAGAIIDAALYDISTGNFVEVTGTRTTPYVTTAADVANNNLITLVFPGAPVSLTAGLTYFAAVHAYAGAGEFYYGTSGTSPDGQGTAAQGSLIFYPNMASPNAGENFYTTATPMVRLSFDPNIGVNELDANAINFNVYPNPSTTGEFTINLNSTESNNVNLAVTNVIGQTIINKTIAVSGQTTETISLADYSKGVYFLTVNNETVKLIVE